MNATWAKLAAPQFESERSQAFPIMIEVASDLFPAQCSGSAEYDAL
jgi:hypothetical protein